ncbi:MAG: hypothetical protein IIC66_11300 [candidate division Zixibacteria bacterium]|nr:hypothetical protein [candidate division Zixibacteria bacterium]
MRTMIIIILTSVFGWVGWWVGYQVGIFTALVLSMVGTGLGIYAGRKINQMYS